MSNSETHRWLKRNTHIIPYRAQACFFVSRIKPLVKKHCESTIKLLPPCCPSHSISYIFHILMTLMSCVKSPHIFRTKHFFLLSKRSDLTHSFHLHNNRGEVLTCIVVYTEEIWAASSEDAFFVTPLTLRGLFSFW